MTHSRLQRKKIHTKAELEEIWQQVQARKEETFRALCKAYCEKHSIEAMPDATLLVWRAKWFDAGGYEDFLRDSLEAARIREGL